MFLSKLCLSALDLSGERRGKEVLMSGIRRSKVAETTDVAPFYLYKNVKLRISNFLQTMVICFGTWCLVI